jgi:hypothetical protein
LPVVGEVERGFRVEGRNQPRPLRLLRVTIRPVHRLLFSIAALQSLVLGVGAAVLWGGGQWYELWAFKDDGGGGRVVLYVGYGRFNFGMTRWPGKGEWSAGAQRPGAAGAFTPAVGYPSAATPVVRNVLGVQVFRVSGWLTTPADRVIVAARPATAVTSVNVPMAPATLILLVLPLAWLAHHLLQRRRRRPGLCPQCSYNLTGNVSGVCPECGSKVIGADQPRMNADKRGWREG